MMTLRARLMAGLLIAATAPAIHPVFAQTPSAAPAATRATQEDARLTAWLDSEYDRFLDFSPMSRTSAGDKKDYDKFDDISEAGMAKVAAFRTRSAAQMKLKFDRTKLSDDGKLSYDLWAYKAREAESAYKFRRNEYVFNQLWGPHTIYTRFLMQVHAVDEPADMDAYIARIRGISRAVLQGLDRAKTNATGNVRPPRFAYDGVIEVSKGLASGAPFDDKPDNSVWADAQSEIEKLEKAGKIDATQAQAYRAAARRAMLEAWGPAMRSLAAWFEADRPNSKAADATGVSADPNGPAYYAMMLESSTNTNLTADQVHQIGLDQVAMFKAQMEAVKNKAGFKGSLQDFFKFMREDDQFYFQNTDAGRQGYIDQSTQYITTIQKRLPEFFATIPKAGVVVKRVEPWREVPGAAQHYLFAAPDGSRPGVFYAHLSDMRLLPKWQLEPIAYHEAGLGHHVQFSIAQTLTGLPKFRTQLFFNSFQEGWGLYTELTLGKEMGGYADDYSEFGRLSSGMWRAIRLVLDTGLHSKGWTEQQAIDYFKANSPQAEGTIRAEVQRYMTQPGQATGYLIGYLRIMELRQKAQRELGPKFDIRGFHDLLLARGQTPIDILARRVDEWIAARKAG